MRLEKNMGSRAREAVEILWNSLPRVPDGLPVSARDRYQAGIRWALRLVAIGFAESRNLLPIQSAVYAESYSLHGLWRHLGEIAARNDHELEVRFSAWPRLLSLVQLVREGSSHPDMAIRPYGGELLEPGDLEADDGVRRALALLELPENGPSDAAVWRIVRRLCCTSRGRRVDFAALETDYVGQLYQAFLEGVPEVSSSGAFKLLRSRSLRKASGAFYTPLDLARATVERTLEPLCQEAGEPILPERLLQIRVCDPAMGSGAFLVAALRCLSRAALRSLRHHGRLQETAGKTVVRWGSGREFELPLPPLDERLPNMLLAHVRRHVVECCLYGVDLDPLSAELARFSLWLETMDRHLPLTFLTHKLKVGDSLVGASLADLETYPLRAWQVRTENSASAHHDLEECTRQLSPLATAARQPHLPFAPGFVVGRGLRAALARDMEQLQRLPVQLPDLKRERYREHFLESPARLELKGHLDTWCALWFWPEGLSRDGLLPDDWYAGRVAQQARADEIAQDRSFFHWELEFPEVFARRRPGFDAVVGNPPWEIVKAEAGKNDTDDPSAALANWYKWRHAPAGRFQKALEKYPRTTPFVRQGAGDTNTYKLFIEQGFALCRTAGRLGFIVPAGIYADAGAGELRHLLVSRGQWEWLYGMDNRQRHFPIDGRFRFAVIVAGKGGSTDRVHASFLNATAQGLQETATGRWIDIDPAPKPRRSKTVQPFIETASASARQALAKMQEVGHGAMVSGRRSWAGRYVREYDAGGAGRSFFPLEHWLRQGWQAGPLGLLQAPGDGGEEGAALPVYQGTMVQGYDFAAAVWDSHGGGAWQPSTNWRSRNLKPRFYMGLDEARLRTVPEFKVAVRRITNATNTRTVVAALVPPLPCTDKAAVLHVKDPLRQLLMVAALNSFCVDAAARLRCAGTQLDRHHLASLPLPGPASMRAEEAALLALRLSGPHPWFAPLWLDLRERLPRLAVGGWGDHFLHLPAARRRAIAAIEALIAEALGLTANDFSGILADCDLPVAALRARPTRARLDPRGFWRVDRELPPAERTTVMALEAFKVLREKGPAALLASVPNGAGAAARNMSWADCESAALPVLKLQGALRKRVGQQAVLL